jgi:hypothetical protein
MVTLFLVGCASPGQVGYRSEAGIQIMHAAITDVITRGYAVDNKEGVAIAICLPSGDPTADFLASVGRSDLFPCSALQVRGGGTVRKLKGSDRRVWECAISSVRLQNPETAVVLGSCSDQSLSGSGFEVVLTSEGGQWVVVSGNSTWIS